MPDHTRRDYFSDAPLGLSTPDFWSLRRPSAKRVELTLESTGRSLVLSAPVGIGRGVLEGYSPETAAAVLTGAWPSKPMGYPFWGHCDVDPLVVVGSSRVGL